MISAAHIRRLTPALLLATLPAVASASNGHFNAFVDPQYSTSIYAGPIGGEGCGAWTLSGHLLTRANGTIIEYSPISSGLHQGTSVHPVLSPHPITGLDAGAAITNAADGYLYTAGSNGVYRVDPNNWATPALFMPNTLPTNGYGINAFQNGKLVYSDGTSNSKVYVYDPVSQVNTLVYSASFLVDDIETGPGGEIALAGQSNSSLTILTSAGSVINQFFTPHFPDGLAFGDGPYANSVYSNNNNGSITRYDFPNPGYTGAPTPVDIALCLPGNRGYGDLATVGPDCAFYIGTYANVAFHGADAGVGTNWDNGVTNGENSIVRVGAGVDRNGLPIQGCMFYSLVETFIPEPSALALLLTAFPTLTRRRR
jgi:hypothetical protein